jgi:hypothetical protein
MSSVATPLPLPPWPRPHFEAGGGDAHLFYKLHGDFSKPPTISRSKYRTAGIPEGIEALQLDRDRDAVGFRFGFEEPFVERMAAEHPSVLAAAAATPGAMVLRGTIRDPENLDYFRDIVGVITAFLDGGATAVFDPYRLDWWTPEEWHQNVFELEAPAPLVHVAILLSEDSEPDRYWMHTRGMIKFGRPDLSMRGLTEDLLPGAEEVFQRFIAGQASGARIPEGKPIASDLVSGDWACHHGGSMDDPDFNNVHVEIRRRSE